ncbi:(4Fe-4S)-binding protein [Parasporobacterium paucivorans]|uniref:Uncharacterized Fe-S cluster protein YjdI n=1 Tax=Parasporobacterium paucivorans DSM 15970 TaxID=1122934 RepID=A0A1M6IBA6_9FIRM|nr:(4Fe-4S)-binding protein [Parasporobacterium paucivorans]SHJ31693.1 Uncharacterized Fe-S cluster protein YjdI [Parasporobacterium paucivorans DSM 15970]
MEKSNEQKVSKYSSDEITIGYYPDRCIHSGVCTRNLPSVFSMKTKPWVNPNGATVEEIKNLIDRCPSGALFYEVPEDK